MRYLIITTSLLFASTTVQAHFLWLVPNTKAGSSVVHVYFGEDADDTSTEYLSFVSGARLLAVTGRQPATELPVTSGSGGVSAAATLDAQTVVVASHDAGVMNRSGAVFRLMYYAKAASSEHPDAWSAADTRGSLKLDVVPEVIDGRVRLKVFFDNQPLAGAQVNVARPGVNDFEGETDDGGVASFKYAKAGVHSIRIRHIDVTAGELNGSDYAETRHYCTVALDVSASDSLAIAEKIQALPQPVTSFGAAIMDGSLYMYGGHTGTAHSYSRDEQSNQLTKLDLKGGTWSAVIDGPHLQGLALVAHGGKLYRIGGFTAENSEGEDHVLNSQASVACLDPATRRWQTLASLPECRSSHDAAVVDHVIYVVGGWEMAAGKENHWHTTAWKMDLAAAAPKWEPIAAPPFQRRALALAAHDEKLFVIGGMQKEGGPTTATSIYDPASDSWHDGPDLVIHKSHQNNEAERGRMSMGNMAGFGASAFATGGSLYVTTVQGTLQRLAADESEWQLIADDITPRFFHRLLPLDNERLIAVGGANMAIGKFEEVDVISVDSERDK